MRQIIIGTAGHIDHGKTALIRALTGVDTDRLKEEKERGITTALGFASFLLPDGTRAGIIDVPGHEKFVGTMITGAVGMDLVLLVIAADEGVMPQTREHAAILQQLGAERGLIVLNKCDLADREWLELVRQEIEREFAETCFAEAPVAEVSAVTGQGLPRLVELIQELTAQAPARDLERPAWLPIDRVFTMKGFGTVVTGTLMSGRIRRGEELKLYPSGLACRVRGLQVYGQETESSRAGLRTAVNLADVDQRQVRRGEVLAPEGSVRWGSGPLDVRIDCWKGSVRPVTNRQRMHLCIGTDQLLCRAVLLDRDSLEPGQSCYAQLLPERPLAARPGERFILRFYSPVESLGGGLVLDVEAPRRKRFRREALEELEQKEKGGPEARLDLALRNSPGWLMEEQEAADRSGLSGTCWERAVEYLRSQGRLRLILAGEEAYLISRERERKVLGEILKFLERYHEAWPYRQGVGRAEVISRFLSGIKPAAAAELLSCWEQEHLIGSRRDLVWKYGFHPAQDEAYRQVRDRLAKEAQAAGYDFPRYAQVNVGAVSRRTADEIFACCLEQGEFLRLGGDSYTLPQILKQAEGLLMPVLSAQASITVAQVRDLLGSSRRSAKLVLELLEKEKIIKEKGAAEYDIL